jgi:CobQ-like glutamine amidotransferase family enzyme
LVGPVVAAIDAAFPIPDGADQVGPDRPRTVVGFENHGGRTVLDAGSRPFATVEIGHGNNDLDATEGVLVLPDEGGLRGLRVGTYLHGPLLPRNPHIADALIAAALGRGTQPFGLAPLDDRLEWRAHDLALDRLRQATRRETRIPGWAHHAFDPVRSLIGF